MSTVSEPVHFLLVVLLGFLTGMVSGAFGVGGAAISTPGIRLLGATPFEGVGSTMPPIVPSAITSTIRYHRAGLVRWRIVAWTALGGAVTAMVGAKLSRHIPGDGHLLMIATAIVLFINALSVARTPRANLDEPEPVHAATGAPKAGLLTIGALAGLLAGLLGVGGGILIVPAFVRFIKLTVKEAVASSIAAVSIISVPSIIGHQLAHNINWTYALGLSIAIVPGAWVGSGLAIKAQERTMRIVVAALFAAIALGYGIAETIALVN